MSKELREHEVPNICQPSNQAPAHWNNQMLPGMGNSPPTNQPHPPDYDQIVPMINAPQPTDMVLSLPYPINNQEMLFPNPPKYSPGYSSGMISLIKTSETPSPHPSPQPSPRMQRMMPPVQYPGPGSCYPAVPVVVTTQATSTVISTPAPVYRHYLAWSIFNVFCCCFLFGLIALVFSIQTRSATLYQDLETARRKSRIAQALNTLSSILGIALIIGLVVFYTHYYDYSDMSYYG